MTQQHTTGPWTASPLANKLTPMVRIGTLDRNICNVFCDTQEGKIDAHLIAAAPELLAAAVELLRNAEYADGQAIVLTHDCEALEAAIAKATGGAA